MPDCLCSRISVLGKKIGNLPLPDPGNVTLTLDEYNRLVELAAKPPKKPELAPLPYSIKHADVKLHVEKDAMRGTVELDGEVFRKGISKVPLTSGMTILDAQLNGKGVPLIQENGYACCVAAGRANFRLRWIPGMPLRIEAGRASFTLPVPLGGKRANVAGHSREHHILQMSRPGMITERKSEKGHTEIEATLVPGQPRNFLVGNAGSRCPGGAARNAIPLRHENAHIRQRSGNARCRAGGCHRGARRAISVPSGVAVQAMKSPG